MKPTSIVFLSIALLLIIGGILTCVLANNAAADNGIMLFPETVNGASKFVSDFSSSDIQKIDISVDDASVNICGGAEKSYIEIINYRTNFYSLSKTSRVLTFNEIPDIQTMLKFWENGFSFSGVRNVLEMLKPDKGTKIVNIYISDANLNQIKVNLINGDLSVSDIDLDASYDLTVHSGSVTLENITTSDRISVKSDSKLSAKFKNVAASSVVTDAKAATLSADEGCSFTKAEMTADSGKITLTLRLSEARYNIKSKTGTITVYGEDQFGDISSTDSSTETYSYDIKIDVSSADVEIVKPSETAPKTAE